MTAKHIALIMYCLGLVKVHCADKLTTKELMQIDEVLIALEKE